jgi:CheY-like chemotaxis protein
MQKKLLIIDDQAGMACVVGMLAAQLGFDVRTTSDPAAATGMFIAFRPDVVILDMIMPEKDGIDVLHEILLTGFPVRIVLTSGLSESYLRLAEGVARFHGMTDVRTLRKPFRKHDLSAALQIAASAMAAE